MKKSLYLTSALVAASVLALGSSATMAASKAKPMKIGVSGSYKAVVGYSKSSTSFTNNGTDTTLTSYNSVDVKSDSEVHFKGSMKTDSGLTIGVAIELEADKATGTDIDQSYMTIGGGFGTVALGSTIAAAKILAVNAPSTGAVGIGGGDSNAWVPKPAANKVSVNAGPDIGGGDFMKARWVSPTFSGFTVGASYTPTRSAANTMPKNGGNSPDATDQVDLGIKYSGKMGANTINASTTYWTRDQKYSAAAGGAIEANNVGVSATMGAVTVGAAYTQVKPTGNLLSGASIKGSGDGSLESETWNAGAQWAQGATTLSLNYFISEMPLASATIGEDSVKKLTLGGKYAMGPGVDLLGTLQTVDWGDEDGVDTTKSNNGVAIVGGINVKF